MALSKFLPLFLLLPFAVSAVPEDHGLQGSSNAKFAPEGCTKLSSDADWPSPAAWEAALPGVTLIPKIMNTMLGVKMSPKASEDYRYRVKNSEDVQRAVNFARDNNIRLSVIATGHDFMGRSAGASGLLLDTSLLTGINILQSFTPTAEGAPSSNAGKKKKDTVVKATQDALDYTPVTIGAGIGIQALNNVLAKSKLFAHGAAHGSVSVVGGWGQLGGHAPLSQQYGLGVDQWLEAKIVTADGKYVIANEISNPDLFWAIRGGGGGTFGVVVEATIKTYPDIPVSAMTFWINSTHSGNEGQQKALAYFRSEMPNLYDKGVSGYFMPVLYTFRGLALHPGKISGKANVNALWKPILETMQSFDGMVKFQSKVWEFPTYKTFYDKAFGMEMEGKEETGEMKGSGMMFKVSKRHGPGEAAKAPSGRGLAPMDSHLLTAEHLRDPKVSRALNSAAVLGMGGYAMLLVSPRDRFNGSNTSANPAWRKATAHFAGIKLPGLVSMDGLRKFAPGMGAYGNEAFYGEPDWQKSFWGDNYFRLAKIKAQYDPKGLFWVTPGISAEKKTVKSGRLCDLLATQIKTISSTSIAPSTDNQNSAALTDIDALFGRFELINDFPALNTLMGIQE